jgi:aminopeptidase N
VNAHSNSLVKLGASLLLIAMVSPYFCIAQASADREEMLSTLWQMREMEMKSWREGVLWAEGHGERGEGFDSQYAEIDIEISFEDSTIDATVQTQFQSLTDGLSEVVLDFDDALSVDSVFGNASSYTLAGETLTVDLDRMYDTGETFSIATTYHGQPRVIGGLKGFRFVSHHEVPVVATLCTPYLAHTWWPCVDGPADKLDSVHLYITIPDTSYGGFPLYAASNGKLVSVTRPRDGQVTYEWHENYSIVPYYVSIAVSNYHIFSHFYPYDADSMEVPYYVFPESYEDAQETFSETVDMIAFFADLYGEYPFISEKYSMAEIGFYGAIEKQTKTIMGGVTPSWYMVVCHELSHMWFGDMISPVSWHHVWVNEGFATYSEALWWGHLFGMDEYHAYMADLRYTGGGTIYLDDISDPFRIFLTIVYDKGAWVLHMLRHVVGDSTFFDILHTYATDPRFMYANASTEDFQEVCETVSGLDLSDFFDQWIYDEYYPLYKYWWISTERDERGTYQVEVNIQQVQGNSGWRPVFVMPIDLLFRLPGGDTTVVVQNDEETEMYYFEFDEPPTDVEMDPDDWILMYAQQVDGVGEVEGPPTNGHQDPVLRCLPNPVYGQAQIDYVLSASGEFSIDLYNAAGQRLVRLDSGYQDAGIHHLRWNFGGLPSGIYFLRLTATGRSQVDRVTLLK